MITEIELEDDISDPPSKVIKIHLGEYNDGHWFILKKVTGDMHEAFPQMNFDGYWLGDKIWLEYEVPTQLPINSVLELVTRISLKVSELINYHKLQLQHE